MPYSRAAEAALLKWVNTFPLDSRIESLTELSDGFVLSKMLEDIDSAYAVKDLEKNTSPSKWLSKKKSLEAVHRSLLRYIRNNCDDLEYITLEDPVDFNAIAEHDDVQQTEKLLTIFLMAAVKGVSNEKYVGYITERLDASTQAEIAKIIQQMDAQQSNSRMTNDGLPPTITKDIDLAFEEEHALLYADHEALKKKHADFITRFERLRQSHDELLDHSNETDRQLQSLQSSNDGDQADYVKSLKSQLQEANELIANQEQQAETDRMTKERHQKELASLRPSAQRLIDLEDQVKELKTENQTLSRKANTVDHFQRKLELQSGIEKENATLRQRIDKLEETQKDLDAVYDENSKIKTTIEEYQKRFNSYELQVVELGNQKKLLDEDLRHQNAQVDALRASKQHDEKFIEDLQEQVRTVAVGPMSPSSPSAAKARGLTLEEELEESDESTPNYALEISRLRAENQLLKSNTAGTTNVTLRIDLEESERIRKRLEENLRDVTEKYAIGQEQLLAIISTSSDEKSVVKIVDELMSIGPLQILMEDFYRNEAVINTRRLYLEANHELTSTKGKLAETQAVLSSRDRELLAAKADLSAIDRDEIDALEDLKHTNEIITSSINNDLLLAQSKLKNLATDYEQQKSHLIDALLAKDTLRQELASAKEGKPAAPILEAAAENTEAQAEDDKARTALDALNEQIKKQEAVIQDLQRRLKHAEEEGPDAQKAANEALIKNLVRENALMTTAWYDLSTRLQSNHVVLQRRQDAPKSWLNKQRQLVNAMPRR